MSAFLGPIHYWLYGKIELQNRLANEIVEKLGDAQLKAKVDETCGTLPEGKLEDMIETDNIHGWLQEKVHLVEKRLSAVVEGVCNKNISLDEIKKVAYETGVANTTLTKDTNALQAYKFLNDMLLDGMPCDHVNVMRCQEETKVEWMRSTDIHQQFWGEDSVKENRYDAIRDSLIQGLISTTKLNYRNDNNVEFFLTLEN